MKTRSTSKKGRLAYAESIGNCRSWQCDVRKCHRCQRLIFDTTGSLEAFCLGTNQRYFEKREDKIANDLDSAEQSRINSAKMEQEREQQLLASRSDAADIIKNAKESGELSRQNILKDAQEEAARLKSKAQADITVERDSALNSVKTMLQNYLFKSRKKS